MNITNHKLLHGCIRSSIAHAIMTNCYPDLAYEQSWDKINFSSQNGCGLRGTITFLPDCCIGAIRNDYRDGFEGLANIKSLMQKFPMKLQKIAEQETLQYLLVDHGDEAIPSVTSIFWCDSDGLYISEECRQSFNDDFSLFQNCCAPFDYAVDELVNYYGMDTSAYQLFLLLLEQKGDCLERRIVLTEQQKNMLPGSSISNTCVETLSELNIFL